MPAKSWVDGRVKPVFISGVAGFLGSHLAQAFLDMGWQVRGIDNLLGGTKENVPAGVEFMVADCREPDEYASLLQGSQLVYHCAAAAYDGLSVFAPLFVHEHTCSASVALASASVEASVERFVFCSSMSRYGAGTPPFTEEMEPRPVSPYGVGKYAAELTLRSLCAAHGMQFNIAVPHNIIGPRQRYDDPYRNVVGIMINRMLHGQQPVIYGDGSQVRCFSYVTDVVPCLQRLGTLPSVVDEVVNVGPDEEQTTILKLAGMLADIIGLRCDPIFVPGPPQQVSYATCSSDKARRMLGYQTQTSLRSGLEQVVEWIAAHGRRGFDFRVPLEIVNDGVPATWTRRL